MSKGPIVVKPGQMAGGTPTTDVSLELDPRVTIKFEGTRIILNYPGGIATVELKNYSDISGGSPATHTHYPGPNNPLVTILVSDE